MATTPAEKEVEPTHVERVRAKVVAATGERQRPVTLIAICAGLAALAPTPFDALAAALMAVVAFDLGRRR